MGCYFLLIEEELRIRPSHGFIVCGDGTRHKIENTQELRSWVLELAGQIRAARAAVSVPIPGRRSAAHPACGRIAGRLGHDHTRVLQSV
jgi:CRISPR-associated exonuclease Cas4